MPKHAGRVLLALGSALLAASAAQAQKTDVIALRNGDRITGEVQSLDRGKLTLKTDDLGTIAIEWDKVTAVTAAASFEVEDLGGIQYFGSLEPGSSAGQLNVVSPEGTQTLDMLTVDRIQRLGATFWKRLDGSIDVGLSYTSASQLLTFNFGSQVVLRRPGHKLNLSANSTIQRQPDESDTRRNNLLFGYQRIFPNRWVALAQGQLEQNRELGFDLRSSVLGGGGRYFVKSRKDELLAGLGVSVNHEIPTEGVATTNVELATALSYDRFSYDFPKVDIYITLAGYLSMSDWGRERLELNARLRRELLKDFSVSLSGYESYDSRPPTAGVQRNDYGITFALGWTF